METLSLAPTERQHMASPLTYAKLNQAESMIVLTTDHLPQEEVETVETLLAQRAINGANAHRDWFVIAAGYTYDGAVYDPLAKVSNDVPVLNSLASEARKTGVRWLMFDADVTPTDGLTVYDR